MWLLEASFKQAGYFLFSGQRHGFGLAHLGFSWIGFFGAAEGVFASKLCSYDSRGGGGFGEWGSRLRIAADAARLMLYPPLARMYPPVSPRCRTSVENAGCSEYAAPSD
jgi:hypothetical protein